LNIDVRAIGIHFTGEHAAKLKAGDDLLEPLKIADDFTDRGVVIFFDGHFEEFTGIGQAGRYLVETFDDLLKLRALLPKRLCTLRLVPDIRLFELALDLGQAFRLALVVKDTSSTHQSVRRGR